LTTPFEALRAIASQKVQLDERLEHHEVFTLGGLLTLLWHGTGDEHAVVVCVGGAMGGLLGPADGLYHDLGTTLAAEHGIAVIRVGYRKPNDLDDCVMDTLAVLQLAAARGAQRAVTVGHSFGGAVAVQAGVVADDMVRGVVTLATQSAGCEVAEGLAGRPVLCIHGTNDELLPSLCSELVAGLSGGELQILEGAGHLLTQGDAPSLLRTRLLDWLPRTLQHA
jgi:fermentation-respiration switch protein FrsA (DUF1100 family)